MDESLKLLIEYGIIGILVLLSIFVVGLGIDKWFFYRSFDLDRYKERVEVEIVLTKNLTFIYTVAANAVYIGLLGTVLGIMLTFSSLGDAGMIDAKMIMKNLSYTLIATAAGLVVAIPSMAIYNALARQVEIIMARWDARHGH